MEVGAMEGSTASVVDITVGVVPVTIATTG